MRDLSLFISCKHKKGKIFIVKKIGFEEDASFIKRITNGLPIKFIILDTNYSPSFLFTGYDTSAIPKNQL